jgi:hypothetical protein
MSDEFFPVGEQLLPSKSKNYCSGWPPAAMAQALAHAACHMRDVFVLQNSERSMINNK